MSPTTKTYVLLITLFISGVCSAYSQIKSKNTQQAVKLFRRHPLVKGKIFKVSEVRRQLSILKRGSTRYVTFLMRTPFSKKKNARKNREFVLDEVIFLRDLVYDENKKWFFNEKIKMENVKDRFPKSDEIEQIYQFHQLGAIYKEDSISSYIDNYTDSLYNFVQKLSLVESSRGYFFKKPE